MHQVSVIGQGYVGFPLSMAIVKNNIKCVGIDNSQLIIKQINNLKLKDASLTSKKFTKLVSSSLYECTVEYKSIRKSQVVIFCLPTPLNSKDKPDSSILLNAIEKSLEFVQRNTLLIIESTVETGFTTMLKYLFSKKIEDLNLDIAFSPERIDPLNEKWDVKNTPKLVAGLTDRARDRAVEFYSKFIDTVIPCSSLEVAETAKLLENSFRLINISFINELAIFCNKIGIDVQEVIKAASTKPYGFMPFYPSVGIGGHCIPVDPVYLSHKAKEVGAPTSFIDLATKVNHEMPKYFVKRASQMLGKVKNKNVLVLGVSYKPNISDVRETPVEALIDGLRKKGAKVKWHDEIVKKWRGEKSAEITDKYDLAIIATPHDYFDLKNLGKTKILNTRSSI
jgi:UDP-N-acetyl-D-glucosamine dehydrogenase